MVKHRIRFEPIDITDKDDFIYLFEKMRAIINSIYKDDHDEVIPAIRKIYPVGDDGFPLSDEITE